jgi:hypothetical protein
VSARRGGADGIGGGGLEGGLESREGRHRYMKKFLLALLLLSAFLLSYLGYERLFVEKSFGAAAVTGFVVIGTFFILVLLTWALYDTRHRGKMSGLWLAAFSTIGTFLIADLICGWILIKPLSPALVHDAYRHHVMVPDSWSRIEQPDFSYVQRVNKLGLRGKETTLEKPAGVVRILVLGDSFTMGKGVEDDETFAVLLEKGLNERGGAACQGKTFEVLNGGVDSYAPILSNIALRRDLGKFSPDLVIENLDLSDLVQEAAYRGQARREGGVIVAVPNEGRDASMTDRLRDWIDQHLFFTRAGLYYLSKRAAADKVTVRNVVTHAEHEIVAYTLNGDQTPRDAQWRDLFESIAAMKAFAEQNNAKFALSVYPWGYEISDAESIPGRYAYMSKDETAKDEGAPDSRLQIIRRMSAENGITLTESHGAFRRNLGTERLYFRQDPHWTPKGQRVMAESLQSFIEETYLPEWCR